jgi:transcription elongation factor Elf1
MNTEERQELREKHFLYHFNKCGECFLSYPCDVIKVLDELDQIAFWVDYRNGLDVYGAIGRIQNLLDGGVKS